MGMGMIWYAGLQKSNVEREVAAVFLATLPSYLDRI